VIVTQKYLDELSYRVIGCAIEVHKVLGPGLLESVYQKCFVHELFVKGIFCVQEVVVPIHYKGVVFDADLRLDVLIEDLLVVELKAVDALHPVFQAKLMAYMKLMEKPTGILINFNCTNIFKEGQKTVVNEFYASLPRS
jgi:GxxExxY protein